MKKRCNQSDEAVGVEDRSREGAGSEVHRIDQSIRGHLKELQTLKVWHRAEEITP